MVGRIGPRSDRDRRASACVYSHTRHRTSHEAPTGGLPVRALLSVSDLDGLVAFARGLKDLGWDLVATDGTRAALKSEGIDARSVEDITGSPTLLGGRVKTLHPRIHAAVLARRDDDTHIAELAREGIDPIDLVAVNLYGFSKAAGSGKRGTELMEQI